jgi:hypothetical protein
VKLFDLINKHSLSISESLKEEELMRKRLQKYLAYFEGLDYDKITNSFYIPRA